MSDHDIEFAGGLAGGVGATMTVNVPVVGSALAGATHAAALPAAAKIGVAAATAIGTSALAPFVLAGALFYLATKLE